MKTKVRIFLIFILFLFSCNTVDLEKAEDIKITNKGIKLNLTIKNPYPFAITLYDLNMDITIDNYKFNNIEYTSNIRLKSFSKEKYPIIVDLHPMENFKSSAGALFSMLIKDSTKVYIQGSSRMKVLFLDLNVKFNKDLYIKYNIK